MDKELTRAPKKIILTIFNINSINPKTYRKNQEKYHLIRNKHVNVHKKIQQKNHARNSQN